MTEREENPPLTSVISLQRNNPAAQQVQERLRQRREGETTNSTLDPAEQEILSRLQQKRDSETNGGGR